MNLADVIRAVEGPLVGVRGQRPEEIEYVGSAAALQQVWVALRDEPAAGARERHRRRRRRGKLPKDVLALTHEEEAWHTR